MQVKLKNIEEIVLNLPTEKVIGRVVYIELDTINYEALKDNIDKTIDFGMPVLNESKVEDIGKCMHLNFMGHQILITCNKQAKEELDYFYIAFKTKIQDEEVKTDVLQTQL
jgi:hypothetical protein